MKTLQGGAWLLFMVGLLIGWAGCVPLWGQSPADAEALQSAGDWRGAEAIWRRLATQNPNDYRLWTSLGVSLAHQSKYNEAIDAYRKSLALNSQAAQTNFNLGLAYFKSGQIEKAILPLQAAEEELRGNQQIETVLGMCFYGTGKYREALPHLELAQSKDPGNKELKFVIAQAYLWGGEYGKAKAAFQDMLAREPNSPEVQILLGEAYDGLGRTEEGIRAFREATKAGQVPEAHFGLGYLLWKSHQYEEAVTEFRSELTIDSKNYNALAYLGDSELELGDVMAAQRDLLKSIDIRDVLWITHFDLGKLQASRKEYAPALKQFRRAIALEPDRPEAHYRAAQVYQALGEVVEAHAELQTVSRLHAMTREDLVLKISGRKPEAP